MIVVRGRVPFYWGVEEPEIPPAAFWSPTKKTPVWEEQGDEMVLVEVKEEPIFEETPIPARAFELKDQRRLTWAWLQEVEAPYRQSYVAIRVKLTKRKAIHIGLCRRGDPPTQRDLSSDHESWEKFSPGAISGWGVKHEESDQAEEERPVS